MALLDDTRIDAACAPARAPLDERAARRTLRAQIARLERELSDAVVATFPHVAVAATPAPQGGPRLLSLGELEAVRDDLAERVRRARAAVIERGERERAARALLERMLVEPERHRWVRLPAAELGERGCGVYHVRPRLSLIGMLMGWWQVKLSSGCPLAGAGCAAAPGRTRRISSMGRRSRKRAVGDVPPREAPAPASAPARTPSPPRAPTWRARMDEAPKAVWSPFPLTELCILLSIVLITLGFLTTGGRRGVLLAGGFTLVTLAAGELAVREHFAGYRSHSALLAGICAILAALPFWLLPVSQIVVLAVGVVVFLAAFVALRRAFIRRSGGVGFRA